MKKLITGLTAASLLALLPMTAYAQSIPPELAKELAKKYSERSRVTVDFTENARKTVNIGPYVAENVFNLSNARPLGKASNRVRKFCEKKQVGTFNQTSQILPNYALSTDPISITENGKTLSVTAADLYFMSRTLNTPTGKSSRNDGWPDSHRLKYEKLSREAKLGTFNCTDAAGSVLWSVAIIPNQFYERRPSILEGDVLWKKQISILPLDIETLETFEQAKTALAAYEAGLEQDKTNAQAEVASKASDFQATADVGVMTNCGMIIQNRRPIFEVDLKSDIARNSGKSTAWIKVDDLRPEDSREACRIN